MRKLTKAEQELHIWICADEDHFTVYSTYPRWTRYFRARSKKSGGREFQHQGGTKFFLPASELQFTAKRRLHLSEAEKARRKARVQATQLPPAATD
jgi:hypothetical protein